MDGPPWPGYAAHVLEHFLALGRLNVLRFAERVEVLAAQHGQRAQLQVLQHLGLGRFCVFFCLDKNGQWKSRLNHVMELRISGTCKQTSEKQGKTSKSSRLDFWKILG